MPFERYLHYAPDHDQGDRSIGGQQPPPVYQDYALPRTDVFQYDPSIFSGNVQFQMPQLILGPTIAPGGGAEVLPAGIVGRQSAIASNWLGHPVGRVATDDSYVLNFCFVVHTFISSPGGICLSRAHPRFPML